MAIGKNKKRITITLPDDLWNDICLIADFTGNTKSQVVSILTAYLDLDNVKEWLENNKDNNNI